MSEIGQSEPYVILGAGPLGLAVMDAVVSAGKRAYIANRSGHIEEALPDGVSVRQVDLTDPDSVETVVHGAQAVFMCASPPYTEWAEKFPQMIDSVIEAVSRDNGKLVFGDNLYMYGPTGSTPIREDLPYAATGRKGKVRAQVANRLLDAHRAGKLQVAIGRGSDFFGPRVTNSVFGKQVFGAALQGKTVNVLGDVDLLHTYTYIRDFADSLLTLANHEETYGETWHVPNAPALTTRQWLDIISDQVDHPVKIRSAGGWMVTLLGLFNPALREMKEMMYEFEEPYVVDDSKFRHAFGGDPTEPVVAVRNTLEWYRQHDSG